MTHRVIWADFIEDDCDCGVDMDHAWDYPGSPHANGDDDE